MDIDDVWNFLPHISWYQKLLTAFMGYYAMIAGLISQSVIFIFYEQASRCKTDVDDWIHNGNLSESAETNLVLDSMLS